MLWIKALHVAFMVTWFVGLFYLPWLFAYRIVPPPSLAARFWRPVTAWI